MDLELVKRGESVGGEEMVKWSFDQKAAFCKTLDDRGRVGSYVMSLTADLITDKALEKFFISEKHRNGLPTSLTNSYIDPLQNGQHHYYDNHSRTVCGRPTLELREIADARAEEILSQLPSLKKALSIIDKDTAKRMDQKEAVMKKVKALKTEFETLSTPVPLADLDQNMTIGQFRAHAKATEKRRRAVAAEIDELGKEAQELERAIHKALYNGLPGLSNAVVKVVTDMRERVTAMNGTVRRIQERVSFGDSAAALELLKSFESEVEVSDKVKAEFAKVLETLNLAKEKKLKGKAKKA